MGSSSTCTVQCLSETFNHPCTCHALGADSGKGYICHAMCSTAISSELHYKCDILINGSMMVYPFYLRKNESSNFQPLQGVNLYVLNPFDPAITLASHGSIGCAQSTEKFFFPFEKIGIIQCPASGTWLYFRSYLSLMEHPYQYLLFSFIRKMKQTVRGHSWV